MHISDERLASSASREARGTKLALRLLAPPFLPVPPRRYGGIERVVAVRLHLCTQMRGVAEPAVRTSNTTWHGAYADNAALRAEFNALCAR